MQAPITASQSSLQNHIKNIVFDSEPVKIQPHKLVNIKIDHFKFLNATMGYNKRSKANKFKISTTPSNPNLLSTATPVPNSDSLHSQRKKIFSVHNQLLNPPMPLPQSEQLSTLPTILSGASFSKTLQSMSSIEPHESNSTTTILIPFTTAANTPKTQQKLSFIKKYVANTMRSKNSITPFVNSCWNRMPLEATVANAISKTPNYHNNNNNNQNASIKLSQNQQQVQQTLTSAKHQKPAGSNLNLTREMSIIDLQFMTGSNLTAAANSHISQAHLNNYFKKSLSRNADSVNKNRHNNSGKKGVFLGNEYSSSSVFSDITLDNENVDLINYGNNFKASKPSTYNDGNKNQTAINDTVKPNENSLSNFNIFNPKNYIADSTNETVKQPEAATVAITWPDSARQIEQNLIKEIPTGEKSSVNKFRFIISQQRKNKQNKFGAAHSSNETLLNISKNSSLLIRRLKF